MTTVMDHISRSELEKAIVAWAVANRGLLDEVVIYATENKIISDEKEAGIESFMATVRTLADKHYKNDPPF